uniref:Arminin 375 n=1 Tax=Hydra oligactis TaxID=6088 RepID=ARM75_HYDOL|nr:arminin 375 [Hydra oligactis]
MKAVFAILFLAFIALTYAKSYDEVKEEIKNEVEREIFEDLEEESDELDNYVEESNDAKPWRRWRRAVRRIRWRKVVPYIPAIVRAAGKK